MELSEKFSEGISSYGKVTPEGVEENVLAAGLTMKEANDMFNWFHVDMDLNISDPLDDEPRKEKKEYACKNCGFVTKKDKKSRS